MSSSDHKYKVQIARGGPGDLRDQNRRRELERWRRLRIIKRFSQVGVVLTSLVLIAGYISVWWLKPPPPLVETPAVAKDESIRIDRFTYSAPGPHPFELEAESATVADTLDKVRLTGPKVLYKSRERGKIILTARSGELDKAARTIHASGDVEIRMKGLLIKADQVTYSDKERIVRANSDISIYGEGFSLSGSGLTLFIDTHEARISNNVKTHLQDVKWAAPGRGLPI
jgi:LPS export ABC transporter protein LptC